MDNNKCQVLKPGLLSNKPLVNDSCSDSDSSEDHKIDKRVKSDTAVRSKNKSPHKHTSEHRNRRSRSRDHKKHKSRGSHSHRRRSDRSDSRGRRHHRHRDSSKSDNNRRPRKSPKRSRSPRKSPQRVRESPKAARIVPRKSSSPRNEPVEKRRNYKDDLKNQYCDDAMDPLTRATKLASSVDSKTGKGRVERARKAQDYQSKELIKKAEQLTGITLPKFYNPSAINPLKFAETEQKRKLLWSKKSEPSAENKTVWNVTSVIASRGDDKAAQKFKKLMGIHDNTAPSNHNLSELSKKAEEQAELFRRLDADYQSARNQTHTSRGVGLGYNQTAFIDPSMYLAGRRDVN